MNILCVLLRIILYTIYEHDKIYNYINDKYNDNQNSLLAVKCTLIEKRKVHSGRKGSLPN